MLGGGPYTAAEARDAGLVDRLAYRDEVEARALARAGAGAAVVPMSEYLDAMRPEPAGEATTVAFVRAVGVIRRGSGELGGGVAADDLAQALTEAIDDPGCARSSFGSTRRAARRSRPTRSRIRCGRPSGSASP